MPGGRTTTEEDLPEVEAAAAPQEGDELTTKQSAKQQSRRKAALPTFTPGVRSLVGTRASAKVSWRAAAGTSWTAAMRSLTPVAELAQAQAAEIWKRTPKSREELRAGTAQVRDEVQRQTPIVKAWARQHRVLLAGVTAVAVLVGADSSLALIPLDAPVSPGVAQRIPVAYPLQVQAPSATTKRYLDAINSGEKLREAAVVAAAARSTLERAKAEAAAAVAGETQPWMTAGADSGGALPPGFVLPGVGGFALPAKGAFTSGFGARWGTFHAGIDIAAPLGSPIYAVAAGTVVDAGPAQGFGLWVRIRHDDGTISIYGHMYDFFVSKGERVPAGMQIARIGNRGDSTGPHLHFEIVIDGQHVDPQRWLALHGLSLT